MRNAFTISTLLTLLVVTLGACETGTITDTTEPTGGEDPNARTAYATVATKGELRPTAEQIDEARRRVIASLSVREMGRVDIVDAGVGGHPWFVQFSVGGKGVHDVLEQLIGQGATPADVFLSLAPPEQVIPDVLLRDHALRAARGETKFAAPRRLEFDASRVDAERIDLDCWSGGEADEPESFAEWVDEFLSWASGYVNSQDIRTYVTTAEYPTYGWIPARNRRAMSVCDASHHTGGWPYDPKVTFAGLGYYFPYTIVPTYIYVAEGLGEYESVRFKSSDGPFSSYSIIIDQSYPDPRLAYVAFGSCDHCYK